MKLILEHNNEKFYYCHFKGGNLIIVQNCYTGGERIYTYAEAIDRGIVQFNKEGERIVVGTGRYCCEPSITECRRF